MLHFSLSPERIACMAAVAVGVLLAGHGIGLLMAYGLGHPYVFGFVPLFNFGQEQNIPTLFSTLLMLASALCFFVLYRMGGVSRYARNVWLVLSLTFCFLAVDETAVIHERFSLSVKEWLDVGGYLFFAWVIPYSVGTAVLAAVVGVPIWRLGWRYRLLFGAAGLTFVGGAIGVEMLGGNYYEAHQQQADLNYRLLQTVEELLEFTGLIILLYTLLDLLRSRTSALTVRIS